MDDYLSAPGVADDLASTFDCLLLRWEQATRTLTVGSDYGPPAAFRRDDVPVGRATRRLSGWWDEVLDWDFKVRRVVIRAASSGQLHVKDASAADSNRASILDHTRGNRLTFTEVDPDYGANGSVSGSRLFVGFTKAADRES
jgi:hypothetical protein